ncbi:MAG: enoyl-CoA hydratase/isomerase family protein [Rhodococcus fascians]|uniref:enoyl-CoA hydratase/isomerase family protein n=1 Tax=Nocardiaceae TaxID=85025 RepID=UPI00036F167D|nr:MULTISPECIES: enoyl-CoA hydratase/isomerase family protein [Rhodococcus]
MTDAIVDEPVIYSTDGAVARIRLSRGAASNSIDTDLAEAFERAVENVAADPSVRVVLLSGDGKNFCAGGDVRQMAAAEDTPGFLRDLAGVVHRALAKLDTLPVIVVAAVQGSAAGAGLGLVLASDFVVAGPSSKFAAAYSGVGLSPDCGVSALLPAVVGARNAARMLLTSRVVSAQEALDTGLITDLVDDSDITTRAEELAAALVAGAHPALGETRRLMRKAMTSSYQEHLDDEAETIARVSTSDDAQGRIGRFAGR